ncbi:MAG: hypothetical protein ACRD2N_04100 [Vicinamibacterales bacterium]
MLRAADVDVTLTSPTSCDVTMSLRVEGVSEIDHRIDGSARGIELVRVDGARQVGAVNTVGRTQSLVLRPEESTYRIHYRAQIPDDRADRCPLWLPTISTDGLTRAVRLRVDLPSGMTSFESMPALDWSGGRGEVTLGHLPSFVRVSYGPAGSARGWGIAQTMDAVTVVIILIATAIWFLRRRRQTS